MTDALKVIGNLNVRYYDLFNVKPETRTAEEIIGHLKAGLESIGGIDDGFV